MWSIYLLTMLRHPVTKTFTTLHPATLYSTSLPYTIHLHGFLATRISTYALSRGRSPFHSHYIRTVLREKYCNVMRSFFVLQRFSLGCLSRIQFRFSKQQTRHLLNSMFFWPCIMNWLHINYQLDALIIIYS